MASLPQAQQLAYVLQPAMSRQEPAINDFKSSLQTFIDSIESVMPKSFIDKLQALHDELEVDTANSTTTFLGALPNDLKGSKIAINLVRTYLEATETLDTIEPGEFKIPNSKSTNDIAAKQTDVTGKLDQLKQARRDLREALRALRATDEDDLALLIQDSRALLQSKPVNPEDLIAHLQLARTTLSKLRRARILIPDDAIRELVDNWGVALDRLANPVINPDDDAERRRATEQSIEIHDLLEQNYAIIAEEFSVDLPLVSG